MLVGSDHTQLYQLNKNNMATKKKPTIKKATVMQKRFISTLKKCNKELQVLQNQGADDLDDDTHPMNFPQGELATEILEIMKTIYVDMDTMEMMAEETKFEI